MNPCQKLLLIFITTSALLGCASNKNPNEVSTDRSISTVPWNRPAKWEGSNIGGANPGLNNY